MGKVAFLGAGNMGGAMADRLLQAGHDVTIYNRSPAKLSRLADKGAKIANTPAEAASGVDVVFSMVTNDDASRAVWSGPHGALSVAPKSGTLAIECSSVSHSWALELGAAASAADYGFLDCPVAGRPDAAAAGQLTVFAGGETELLNKARPYLSAFARKIVHFGPMGSGLAFKLIYNFLGAVQVASLAEAMAACAAAGIDVSLAAAAFGDGNTGSPHVKKHGITMASGQYARPPEFTPDGRVKDLSYAIDLIEQHGARATLGETTRDLFRKMSEGDGAGLNDIELFEALKRQTTVRLRSPS